MSIDYSMIIRAGKIAEISAIAHVISQAYKTVAERFELTLQNCPKHPSNCTAEWIANDFNRGVQYYLLATDSNLIGCAAIEKATSQTCYLERVAIIPEERNKGFGNKLIKHIFHEAASMDFQTIGIGIIAEQHELQTWYHNLGFEETGRKVFAHLPFEVLFMEYKSQTS